MATTETIAMGDGTTTEFGFSFPYIKTEDVKVELQEYDATQTSGNQIVSRQTITAFVVPSNNPTVVQFSSIGAATNYQAASGAPLANHAVSGLAIRVRIYRFTDADSVPATFIQGSAIRAQDLNDNFEQNLYIMQERQNTIVSIQTGGIGENVISTNALQDDAVDASKLRDSVSDDTQRAVTTNHIRDNAVTNAKIAAAIDGTKINPDFGNQTITTTGSFGLGTTSPVRNLHIADAQPIIRLEDSDGTNQYGEVFQAGAGLYLDSRNNTANGQIVFRGNGTGNEYARFNSVGDFGLGTSTPATDIHIKSTKPTVRLEDSNSGTPNTYGEGFYNTNALFFDSRNGTINGAIVFRGIGGGVASEYGRFSAGGNFGLGETSPVRNLHITGTFPALRLEDSDSSTANTYGEVFFSTNSLYLDSRNGTSNAPIVFRGNNGTAFTEYGRFTSSGEFVAQGSIQTGNAPLGFNGANYGTQYQIAQSNGSGAANTWVNRSERDAGVSLVSSPAVFFKNIVFDADALSWATKIDVYFSDVSCDDINGNLIIRPYDQTSNYFASGSLVGFTTQVIYNSAATPPTAIFPKKWAADNGIQLDWGQATSTRYGRVTFVRSTSTQWMVDFQATASVNPATGFYQSTWNGNGVQTQPSSGTGQLGGVQFMFDVGNIDLGTACVHYS